MILDEIAASTKIRVDEQKAIKSLEQVKAEALAMPINQNFPFEQALKAQDINFICEVKKASPSKGIIAEHFPYLDIAKAYEIAGASAISVLTEPKYFLGADKYLAEIAKTVNVPVLRKDFTLDEYQIYEAKVLGASAVLLICAVLDEATLKRFKNIADSLGLSCLVEAHDEEEIKKAINCGARIIGVNNRNLKDFTVDVENSLRLRHLVPPNIIFVSESGMKSVEDINKLRANNVQAALIGETFMRAQDKITALHDLYGDLPMRPQIKICGIKRDEDVKYINDLQPDYAGFVFAGASRRYVSGYQAELLSKYMSPYIKKVGVFVDEPLAVISNLVRNVPLDVVQLHGNEDEDFIREVKQLGVTVWKAVRVQSENDVKRWRDSSADLILFDAYSKHANGGTGTTFNWNLLKNVNRKFVLAGGLNNTNIARAIRTCRPYAVDISSGVETNHVKDKEKMRQIMMTIRKV